MIQYNQLSDRLQQRIVSDRKNGVKNPYRFNDENAVRRNDTRDAQTLIRPAFVRDTEKILHLPFYNRYADKTQVISFDKNDDITRRALHVQLVSKIARNIGAVLGLNLDLIEAISLGHDIGHTPFGHAGERILNEIYNAKTGKFFNHNVHSVRVLDCIFNRNLTFQTLDGILCHNGEAEMMQYRPQYNKTFEDFDKELSDCYTAGQNAVKRCIPSTLEGCLVRICDIIAYLGKDRQDAQKSEIVDEEFEFSNNKIGTFNASIINNLTVDIIENSYGKDCICLSKQTYDDLVLAKNENYEVIYKNEAVSKQFDSAVKPMFYEIFENLLSDFEKNGKDSFVYKNYVCYILKYTNYYGDNKYISQPPCEIVTDFIASMTDDYFVELHKHLFPESKLKVEYKPYFS